MTIDECKDLEKPFVENAKIVDCENEDGSIWMVLLSTCVAVCGSFEFGSCVSISIYSVLYDSLFFLISHLLLLLQVGYSAPTQSQIRNDLNLTLAEVGIFF